MTKAIKPQTKQGTQVLRPIKTLVKPEPQEKPTRKAKTEPEAPPAQKIAISLDVSGFQNVQKILEQRYNDGRLIGFREGVKYIVTLTSENSLATGWQES